jgi:hypothetical protein
VPPKAGVKPVPTKASANGAACDGHAKAAAGVGPTNGHARAARAGKSMLEELLGERGVEAAAAHKNDPIDHGPWRRKR